VAFVIPFVSDFDFYSKLDANMFGARDKGGLGYLLGIVALPVQWLSVLLLLLLVIVVLDALQQQAVSFIDTSTASIGWEERRQEEVTSYSSYKESYITITIHHGCVAYLLPTTTYYLPFSFRSVTPPPLLWLYD
jgi:hypothetical protein